MLLFVLFRYTLLNIDVLITMTLLTENAMNIINNSIIAIQMYNNYTIIIIII